MVWTQIVAGHVHEVLPVVQYDALGLRQLLLLEVLEQVLLQVLQVLRLLELLLKAELHHQFAVFYLIYHILDAE